MTRTCATAERIRDKVAASRKKGMWMGGVPPYGYRVENRKLVVDEDSAARVGWIFARFLEIGSCTELAREVSSGIGRTLTLTAKVGQSPETIVAEVLAAQEPDSDSTPGNAATEEDDYAAIEIIVGDPGPSETPPIAPPDGLPQLHVSRGVLIGTGEAEALMGGTRADLILARDGADYVFAGSGSDRALGQGGDDFLVLGDGNDRALGGDGSDAIWGEAGDDRLVGNHGDDFIFGGDGKDWLHGGKGNDDLRGGAGRDRMLGGDGNDLLSGGSGDDWMYGGDGNDTLDGGQGHNRLWGGDGHDVFRFTQGDSGRNIVYGWDEGDMILFDRIAQEDVEISEGPGGRTALSWEGGRVELWGAKLQPDDIAYI